MEDLARKYAGEIDFVFIYCKEAHPAEDKPITNLGERLTQARKFARELKVKQRVLVDNFDEQSVQQHFGALNDSVFLLDAQGRVLLKLAIGMPAQLDLFLRDYLVAHSSKP